MRGVATSASRPVRVWDWQTRAFHWLLVAAIASAWWSYHINEMRWHKLCGFFIIALIAFRLWWGILGSSTARFSSFLRGPSHVLRYLRGEAKPVIGHNPLGGWSIAAMIAFVSVESALGLFSIDQDYLEPGPLSSLLTASQAELATKLHRLVFDGLLALIALHLAAVLSFRLRGNDLIVPMVTGRKRLAMDADAPEPPSKWAFAIGSLVAIGVFLSLLKLDSLQ